MLDSGYAFIKTFLNIKGEMPIEIIPDHSIRKATKDEIDYIKSHISKSLYVTPPLLYDTLVITTKTNDNPTSFRFEQLPENEWKYYVLAFNGTNNLVHEIEKIGYLFPYGLEFAFEIYFEEKNQKGNIIGWQPLPLHIIEYYNSMRYTEIEATNINSLELSQLSKYMEFHNSAKDEYPDITTTLKNFYDLRRLTKTTTLITIGYFSVLESLITHQPKSTDTIDSIRRQVSMKMILLRKKFNKEIECSKYFDEMGEKKAWLKLYDYRSAIAHGRNPNVEDDTDFVALKNRDNINKFLKDSIKELLLLSLREPEFITDLKNC